MVLSRKKKQLQKVSENDQNNAVIQKAGEDGKDAGKETKDSEHNGDQISEVTVNENKRKRDDDGNAEGDEKVEVNKKNKKNKKKKKSGDANADEKAEKSENADEVKAAKLDADGKKKKKSGDANADEKADKSENADEVKAAKLDANGKKKKKKKSGDANADEKAENSEITNNADEEKADANGKKKKNKKKKQQKSDVNANETDRKVVKTGNTEEEKKATKKKKKVDRWGAAKSKDEDEQQATQQPETITEDEFDSKRVYVGGMPYTVTEDDIYNYFAECGAIEKVDCSTFGDSGKFNGIVFITFKTESAAKKAHELDGADMGGRFLKIQKCLKKFSKSKKEVEYREPPPKVEGCNSAYIGNLWWGISEDDLKKFFKGCKIEKVRLAMDKNSGDFKGYGHVDFSDEESLDKAIGLNQELVMGRPIKIAYAVAKKSTEMKENSAKGKGCFSCGEEGHISSLCPKRKAF